MIQTIAEARAAELAGRSWLGFLRRNGPTFVAGRWHDMSYAAGNPVANYYASAPLVAAVLNGREGIDTGPAPAAGMRKRLATAMLLPGAGGGSKLFWFADYCLYYPFIDGDGGAQDLDNTVPIPRYSGEGCQAMAVCQGTGLATGVVRITYTNSQGTAGRTADTTLDLSVTPGVLASSLAAGVAHTAPGGPWLNLQHGDSSACAARPSMAPAPASTPGGPPDHERLGQCVGAGLGRGLGCAVRRAARSRAPEQPRSRAPWRCSRTSPTRGRDALEILTLPSAIASTVQTGSAIATALGLSSGTAPALQLPSPIATALTLPSAIELEDTDT